MAKQRKRRIRRKSSRKQRYGISAGRLQHGLRTYSRTKDIAVAAGSIGVSVDRFKRAALRKAPKRKRRGGLAFVRRLPRRMPIFSDGQHLAITVRNRTASLIGRFMSAVGQFLKANDPKYLAEFKGRSVKDVKGRAYQFETDPNALYRLSSAGNEPFEDVYRIVI